MSIEVTVKVEVLEVNEEWTATEGAPTITLSAHSSNGRLIILRVESELVGKDLAVAGDDLIKAVQKAMSD